MKGTRATIGLPGSGLFWTSYQPYSSGHRSDPGGSASSPESTPATSENVSAPDASTRSFESADIEHLVAASTSELAPLLDAARKQRPYHFLAPFVAAPMLILAVAYELPLLAVAALVLGAVAWAYMFQLDQRRLTTTLDYKLTDDQNHKFADLVGAFKGLMNSARVWRVPMEMDQPDWKRHAGASTSVQRHRIKLGMGLPRLVKSNLEFPSFALGKETIYFAPDAVLVVASDSVAALRYDDCEFLTTASRFIEDDGAPPDTQIVGETWQYVNKNGGPDRRFSNNRRLPICIYGQLDLRSSTGLNERLQFSRPEAPNDFVACAVAMRHAKADQATRSVTTNPSRPNADRVKDRSNGDTAEASAHESEYARTLVLQHGKFWDILLLRELLETRLSALKKVCNDLEKSHLSTPTRPMNDQDFMSWLNTEFVLMSSSTTKMASCATLLSAVSSEAADPERARQILRAVDVLFEEGHTFLAFERDLGAIAPPAELSKVKDAFWGITLWLTQTLEHFVEDLSGAIEGLQKGSNDVHITLKFDSPPQLTKAEAELDKFMKRNERHHYSSHKAAEEIVDKPTPPTPDRTLSTPVSSKGIDAKSTKKSIEDSIKELHSLVGLTSIKHEVETLIHLAKAFSLRKKEGLPIPDMSLHLVFSGNPGTGKTTVARIIANVYGQVGLLSKGHLVEVDRGGLVGNYVGQTATKVHAVIEEAKGGVLFIDEAYALAQGGNNDFGQETIETLLKAMEDNRHDLVVIAAGYENRMEEFLRANPGLRSRFPRVIFFPDYSADELVAIFESMAAATQYVLTADAEDLVTRELHTRWLKRGPEFANAREVRNFFERVISAQSDRISASSALSVEMLTTVEEADVLAASSDPNIVPRLTVI
jgi:Holliday junction resolvasome RuvABC ATP-dependent DNA helicase subunit